LVLLVVVQWVEVAFLNIIVITIVIIIIQLGIAMSTADANIKTVIVEKTENEILATMKNIEGTYKKSSAYKSGISIIT